MTDRKRKRKRRYIQESTSRMTGLLPSYKLRCKVIVVSKLEARGRERAARARLKQARTSRSKRRSQSRVKNITDTAVLLPKRQMTVSTKQHWISWTKSWPILRKDAT